MEWWLIVTAGVLFVGLPLLLGILAVVLFVTCGLVVLVGSLVVSLRRFEWQWWVPGWVDLLAEIAGALAPI